MVMASITYEAGNRLSAGEWADYAACQGTELALWYPEHHEGQRADTERAIRRYCARCPVKVECGEAGQHERYGVWGGRMPGVKGRRNLQLSIKLTRESEE